MTNRHTINLEDYSYKTSLHCNNAYYQYVLKCLQSEAHLLGCIFENTKPSESLPIIIKQKLALTAAAAKHKYAHPDYKDVDLIDQYTTWVVWDVDDGGAYVWLSNILDSLAMQGIYLHYVSGSCYGDEVENLCLHIRSDLEALIVASDGIFDMPSTVNDNDPEIIAYLTSLFLRLPHPLGGKIPAF